MKVWKKRIYVLNRETDCLVKMKQWEKLAINVDIFLNELYKLSYINSRLADDVVEITQVRRNFNCDNFYLTVNELLKKLAQSFHDSDKKNNYHREYINLIQESKKFSDFFNQFQRLYIYLKYQKNVLVVRDQHRASHMSVM